MEERAVGDRAGEVGGEAAAGGEGAVDGEDAPRLVEADLVVVQEVVALAGRDHVVVAVGAELHRAVPFLGCDGGDRGEEVRLGFLAAEASAHAADDDGHGVRGNAEDVGDHVLHLGGVLGGGIDRDVVVLARDGEGDHALEVEMVLAADAHPALQPVRRRGQRRGDVAALELQGLGDERIVRVDRGCDVGHVRQVAVFDLGELRRAPGSVAGLRDHREQGLAVELDRALDEDRVVVLAHRADVVVPGDVGTGQHTDHAGGGPDGVEVHRQDLGVRPVGEAEVGVQRSCRLGDVVAVFREAGDVLVRRVVALRHVHAAADRGLGLELGFHHATASRTSFAPPWVSRKKRRIRFRATMPR